MIKKSFSAAKAARTHINLMQYKTRTGTFITADFAKCNESQSEEKLSILSSRQSFIHDRVVAGLAKCSSCSNSLMAPHMLSCANCFTKNSATFYCNERCQVRDWSVHKRDCKRLPQLKLVEDLKLEEERKPKFVVPFVEGFSVGDTVKLTHVQSHKVLFARDAKGNFEELLASIDKIGDKGMLTEKPEVGDTVLALHKSSYYRAQIMDVFETDENENHVQMFFLDFGYSVQLPWQQLRKLSFKARSLHRQTFKVVLEEGDVLIPGSNQEFKKYLDSLCLKELELKVVRLNMRGQDRYVTLEELHGRKVVNNFHKAHSPTDDDARIFFDVSLKIEHNYDFDIFIFRIH